MLWRISVIICSVSNTCKSSIGPHVHQTIPQIFDSLDVLYNVHGLRRHRSEKHLRRHVKKHSLRRHAVEDYLRRHCLEHFLARHGIGIFGRKNRLRHSLRPKV